LSCLKSSWQEPEYIDFASEKAQQLKAQIKRKIITIFGEMSLFGFKDPRLCLLLPLYLEAAQELGYAPQLVIVKRNPLEIAESLAKRSEMTQDKALALAYKYRRCIEEYTKGYNQITVSFDDLVNNPLDVADRLRAFLPELKAAPLQTFEQNQKILNFISKDLKHHNFSS
jgi:hypothetical protein